MLGLIEINDCFAIFADAMRFWILILIVLSGCGLFHSKKESITDVHFEEGNEIVFMSLLIKNDLVSHQHSLFVNKQTLSKGVLKNHELPVHAANTLTARVYAAGKINYISTIEHPLYRRLEYVQDSVYISKTILLDESEFFMRVQSVRGVSDSIYFTEQLSNAPERHLLTIKL